MSDKKPKTESNDADLFRQSMKDVKPLSQDKIEPDSAPKTKKRKVQARTSSPLSVFGELDYAAPVTADEILSFARDGVQQKVLGKLKKGQYPIESQIDLHGLTVNNAGAKLQTTIKTAIGNHQRCVLIVHGRGKGSFDNKPAIKTHVNQWLRNSTHVLAFHSAQPFHGGTGALYVLLKRVRDNK